MQVSIINAKILSNHRIPFRKHLVANSTFRHLETLYNVFIDKNKEKKIIGIKKITLKLVLC